MLRRVKMTTQNLKLPDKGKGHEIDGVVFSKKNNNNNK